MIRRKQNKLEGYYVFMIPFPLIGHQPARQVAESEATLSYLRLT